MSRISVLISKPWRTLGALGLLLAAAAVAVGSGAAFTASSANPSNTFSAGSLSMSNDKSGSAILTASGMKPGDPATTGTVVIKNTGSLSGAFTLNGVVDSNSGNADPVANPYSGILDLTVTDCGADQICGGANSTDDVVQYDATTPSAGTGKLDAVSNVPLGTFAPNDQHTYLFSVSLPGTAGDAYQSAATSVTFNWTATT